MWRYAKHYGSKSVASPAIFIESGVYQQTVPFGRRNAIARHRCNGRNPKRSSDDQLAKYRTKFVLDSLSKDIVVPQAWPGFEPRRACTGFVNWHIPLGGCEKFSLPLARKGWCEANSCAISPLACHAKAGFLGCFLGMQPLSPNGLPGPAHAWGGRYKAGTGILSRLESFQDSRYAFHPFHDAVGGGPHQGNAEVALPAFTEANAGGYHHAFPLHQQLGHFRG